MIKRLCVLLAGIVSLSAANITLSWRPGPLAVQDRVTGYLLFHAGEDGVFTNLCGVAAEPASCVVTNFSIGLHQFRLYPTNFVGVGDAFASASTNFVWKPGGAGTVSIDAVTQKSVTLTFQLSP